MRIPCPYCQATIVQIMNRDGPNFCPQCRKLFYVSDEPSTPPWILGVLAILLCNLQIMAQ